ncbi:Uncharacterised protein [Mycobacteroides abscessus subsp. massiliense]|nr:Uncharacterised protein [Mycobacteroides abscessus subsp. massiliense]SLC90761.1 Uncharacterised protein [Mycobacteroides abscessus subsp. massiliense]
MLTCIKWVDITLIYVVPAGGGGTRSIDVCYGVLMVYRYADLVAESVGKAPALSAEQLRRLTVLFTTAGSLSGRAGVGVSGDPALALKAS